MGPNLQGPWSSPPPLKLFSSCARAGTPAPLPVPCATRCPADGSLGHPHWSCLLPLSPLDGAGGFEWAPGARLLRPEAPSFPGQVLLLSMRDMNIAKLTSVDVPLFNAIVQDLFPNIELPVIDYGKVLVLATPADLTHARRAVPGL